MLVPDSLFSNLTDKHQVPRSDKIKRERSPRPFSAHRLIFASGIASNISYNHLRGAEPVPQVRFPRPARARAAAVEVERGDAEFGIGVTGEVRFAQQVQAGDAAGRGKLVPL